jgi:hypothetical protein
VSLARVWHDLMVIGIDFVSKVREGGKGKRKGDCALVLCIYVWSGAVLVHVTWCILMTHDAVIVLPALQSSQIWGAPCAEKQQKTGCS